MKYTPGLMVGQLSGKAGNTVASRNRAGSYFRTRVIPKKIENPFTTGVRSAFTARSQAYRLLTPTQQAAWSALGLLLVRKNSLGTTFKLSGLQAYQSVNANRELTGFSDLSDAPSLVTPAGVGGFTLTAAVGTLDTTAVTVGASSATQQVTSTANMFVGASLFFVTAGVYRQVASITDATHVVLDTPVNSTTAESIHWTGIPAISIDYNNSPVPNGNNYVVYATAPLSGGINSPGQSPYRFLTVLGATTATPQDISLLYVQRFGQPAAGQKIFVSIKPVATQGFAGTPVENSAVVS